MKYESENDRYEYLLSVFDTFSKHVCVESVKRKMVSMYKTIWKNKNGSFKNCSYSTKLIKNTDKDLEVKSKEFKTMLNIYIRMQMKQNDLLCKALMEH